MRRKGAMPVICGAMGSKSPCTLPVRIAALAVLCLKSLLSWF